MSSALLSAAASLRQALAGFEPGLLSGADCARVAEELAATEKACAAARLLAAARAVGCGAHQERGFPDGAAWMARQVGGTAGQARQALEAAGGLKDCPGTKAALLAGEVSLAQAAEITRASRRSQVPKPSCSRWPAAQTWLSCASPPASTAKPIPMWTSSIASNSALGTSAIGATASAWSAFQGLFPRERCPVRQPARSWPPSAPGEAVQGHGGERERFEAYAADALAAMAVGEGPARSARADLVIVCDLFAWRRGHGHPGEVCHIVDGGPVPVELAHELGKDAFVKAVLHDGVAVHTIKHFGRHLPAELRTALDLGEVPAFHGAQCADCGRRFGLEYDHVNPVANNGPTSFANLKARCWADHQAKTERDRQAGLLGPSPPDRQAGLLEPNPPDRQGGLLGPGPP